MIINNTRTKREESGGETWTMKRDGLAGTSLAELGRPERGWQRAQARRQAGFCHRVPTAGCGTTASRGKDPEGPHGFA